MATDAHDDADFPAPGPGEWALDRSHYPGGTTPISQWLMRESCSAGFERVFAEVGVPAATMDARFVRGFMYTRLRPLVGADKPPSKPPPKPILWLAARLHPVFRARTRQAQKTLTDRPSNDVVRLWEHEMRPRHVAANRALQQVDPAVLDDAALQQHVDELLGTLRENFELHFWLHGHDLGPLARYLHAAIGWGLDPTDAIDALSGASPSTSRPAERLCRLRELVDAAPGRVECLDDVRAVSPEAATLLDEYLDEHGHVMATGYDLTASTLHELPDTILDSIRHARMPPTHDHEALAGALRAEVPAAHRGDFDTYLGDARNVMDMRDDNGPTIIEWPLGLLRRALLEAGRRLAATGALRRADDALELTVEEAHSMFDGRLPGADAVAERASSRVREARLTPPTTLGDPEPEPPLDALPKPLADLTAMVQVAIQYMGMDARTGSEALTGTGIGSERYTGRACVASSSDDAIERLEPGDVLIVRATSPAFNAVLAISGAVVTADGGVLSHAAVLARELGIPAVVGAPGALGIADGSTVEVDPVAGEIRVVAAAPAPA